MRIPRIVRHWKIFEDGPQTIVFAKELRSVLKDVTGGEIVVAPPSCRLRAAEALRNSNILSRHRKSLEREGRSPARWRRR